MSTLETLAFSAFFKNSVSVKLIFGKLCELADIVSTFYIRYKYEESKKLVSGEQRLIFYLS